MMTDGVASLPKRRGRDLVIKLSDGKKKFIAIISYKASKSQCSSPLQVKSEALLLGIVLMSSVIGKMSV